MTEVGTSATALVGRDEELADVGQYLERAAAGRGQLLLLSGEAGVGKSAMIEDALTQAERLGMLRLHGRCWSAGGAPPCWPWTQILRTALSDAPPGWPHFPGDLAALLPELAPDRHARGFPPDKAERFRLYDAVRGALVELARHRPLCIALDELAGAAPPTLEILHLLSLELGTLPIAVVGAYRPLRAKRDAHVDRLLAALSRESVLLPLGGLDVDDVRALLGRLGSMPSHALARQVREATAGNPLLVLELGEGLAGEVDPRPFEGLPISEGLRREVRGRVEPLDVLARALLGPIAVLGPEVDVNRLRPLVGAERGALLDVIGDIIDAGILTEVRDRPGRFRFRHPILQHAVLADLPPAERADLHLRAAAVIEERHAHDLDPHLAALARHYAAGAPEDVRRAIAVSTGAARRATETLELDLAAEMWRLALDQAERGGLPALQRCDLLLALGEVQDRLGDNVAARETFLSAARVARAAEDFPRFARAVLGCHGSAPTPTAGIIDRAMVDLLTEALEHVGDDHPIVRAALLGRLAMERYYVDPRRVRERLTSEAIALAERSGDRAALGRALNARHLALWSLDDLDERLASATEILEVAREANDAELVLQARAWRVVAYLERGDGAAAEREIALHARLAGSVTRPLHRWNARVFLAMRALLEGRLAEAERHADAALTLGARLDANERNTAMGPTAHMIHGVQLFGIRREQGRLAELAEPVAQFAGTYPHLPVWRCGQALVQVRAGRIEQARATLTRFAQREFRGIPRDGNWLIALSLLAEVTAGVGDAEAAKVLHPLLAPHAARVVVVGQAVTCREAVAYHLGMLDAVAGRHAEAVRHHEQALAIHEALGARPAAVRTRLALAASLRAVGRDDGRAELLRDAHATALELDMHAAVAEAEQALADEGALPQLHAPLSAAGVLAAARMRFEDGRWTVIFDGRASQLRDAKGLRYLATLLDEPGVDHPAATLERRVALGTPADRVSARKRFDELRADLASAQAAGDPGQAEAVREAMAALAAELTGAGSEDRSEQARVNVTRAIRTALRNIAAADAALGEHLDLTVRTGASCSYRPDPRAPIRWYVDVDAQEEP